MTEKRRLQLAAFGAHAAMARTLLIGAFLAVTPSARAQPLDRQALLQRESFWDNRDFAWYAEHIPFFDCPDKDLTTTYYYRWEVVTKHLTYGSPNSGYSFTEFIDRPFWSGTYGAISCPAGLQLYEARWLRDPAIARDYVRYWFRTPGAQPRRYSTWLADAAWAVHRVHPESNFLVDLLPDLVVNDEAWKKRHFVPESGLFWQTGHDDGMEYNINSRQSRDPNAGAPGFRPTLNSYMIADAAAIAKIATLSGNRKLAEKYQRNSQTLRAKMLDSLWDPKRQFFFHRFRDDESSNGVHVAKNTLTHESGKFAGSSFGRELHGYVTWQFDIPDDRHADMWKPLVDPQGFKAPFGPTTVERRDPMFHLNKTCCWWSGQSWPYATSQTLKGLANALQRGVKLPISKADYWQVLSTYSKSHRKNGRPYIAEACHPDTGSWEGHDNPNHSEHYFHSNFCDLVITGLVGLIPGDGDDFVVQPLAPDDWAYFALDNVKYRGRDIAIVYDRDGTKYGRGKGLRVFVDGVSIASATGLCRLEVKGPPAKIEPYFNRRRVNFAVNNDGAYYPRLSTTHERDGQSLGKLIDGNYWYHQQPANRFTFVRLPNENSVLEIDLGVPRRVDELRLYLLDDLDVTAPPDRIAVEYMKNGAWTPIPERSRRPPRPEGRMANRIHFDEVETSRIRVTFTRRDSAPPGLSEIELWGWAERPVVAAPLPSGNLAVGADVKTTASFTSRWDKPSEATDGKVNFNPEPRNRWTSYESPNASDWLEIDFGRPRRFSRVELAVYSDGRGVRAPRKIEVEHWQDGRWIEPEECVASKRYPAGGEYDEIRFLTVETSKVRFIFHHALPAKSGVTEVFVWEK